MDILLADVSHLEFKIENDLIRQVGAVALPFYGMDKSTAAVCQFMSPKGDTECDKGSACPFRHIRADRTIVCKHWLRGLCKKGDQCEFLHEYDMKKMPECYFYSRFNACHNKECPFLHIDPESKVKDCPWYDRGFCRHGPHCRHRHVRRVMCINYLAGFCPSGWNCKFMHPRFELPPISDAPKEQIFKRTPICHSCGELGHKATMCKKNAQEGGFPLIESRIKSNFDKERQFNEPKSDVYPLKDVHSHMHADIKIKEDPDGPPPLQISRDGTPNFVKVSKPLEEITCYKCGNKGHYANKCPKGHLAFLSNQRSHK